MYACSGVGGKCGGVKRTRDQEEEGKSIGEGGGQQVKQGGRLPAEKPAKEGSGRYGPGGHPAHERVGGWRGPRAHCFGHARKTQGQGH